MKSILTAIALAALAGAASAQQHDHAAHAGMEAASPSSPREAGQDVFAALREVIQRLELDPSTDWSKVNIGALRAHLVDMDNVMLRAEARATDIPQGVRFDVTATDPAVVASIRRMVTAHARTDDGGVARRMEARELPQGASLTVTGAGPDELVRLRALGFFGLISQGDHHGPHHLAMASGAAGHDH